MPFFQYQATDKQGNPIQGTVQAGTLDEANRALALQGFKVTGLRDPSVIAAPSVQTMAPPRSLSFERPGVPAPVRVNSPTARPLGEARKTRYSQDKDIYFIFSQLAAYFKSGINPAQAFTEIGSKQQREDIKEAMLFVASRVGEGSGIADLLALYPFLFAPHVVGAVRAGEMGGYLPEALENIAAQADSSRKMRRWMVWLGLFAIGIPPVVPIGMALFNSVIASWDAQEASGGTAPVAATVGRGFVQELLGSLGVYSLIVFILFVVLAFSWQSMWFRRFRHKLALMIPTIGKRARAEGFAAFTWNLSNLAKAGIAPRQSFQLASETVPNLDIRLALENQWRHMNDQTKLSEALEGTKMLPHELSAMVQTGEVTGDVAGQLLNGARAQQQEFEHQDKNVKTRVGCWMLLLFFLVGPVLVAFLYGDFLTKMITKLTATD
ncbi:MAG: type II secretion system F family protein [Chlorobia bacterium]|nr:type II secretion system F family protein [Fimbriimonadaceae bacterium]